MATKEEILAYIKSVAEQKVISKAELEAAYESGRRGRVEVVLAPKPSLMTILTYLGGAIVFLGIAILLWQNWRSLSFAVKVLTTLVAGIAAYFSGMFFSRNKRTETVGSAFYLISALVTPIGFWVVINHFGFKASSDGWQSFISGTMLGIYLLSHFVFRKNIFTLFSILFGTWLFFSFTSFLMSENLFLDKGKFYQYRILFAGLCYMFLGYAFSKTERASLCGFLNGFGILGFLGAAFTLGGWKPNQNLFWEMIYPVLIFASLFFSVRFKSKAFLTFGTIFFIFYILKITDEYFSSGLGWPLALVIAGLAMIGVGYLSVSLKKKYLAR
jgi:uncharacterized membrane protein